MGALCFTAAWAVFDELRQGIRNIEALSDPTGGQVRIGCDRFLTASFVSDVVGQLSRRYPRLVFHLVSANHGTLRRVLHERKVDLLITRQTGPLTDARLRFEPLFDDSYVVAAGAQNPLSRRRTIKLAELAGEPWLMPEPETGALSAALEVFRAAGLAFPRASVFAPPEARMKLLTNGRFLSIFSESRVYTNRAQIKMLPVILSIPRVPIGIVTLKDRTLAPAEQLFIKGSREVAKRIPKRGP